MRKAEKHDRWVWFNHRWWTNPIFHLRLLFGENNYYISRNAEGNEQWLVREVYLNGVFYWTAIKRIPNPSQSFDGRKYAVVRNDAA